MLVAGLALALLAVQPVQAGELDPREADLTRWGRCVVVLDLFVQFNNLGEDPRLAGPIAAFQTVEPRMSTRANALAQSLDKAVADRVGQKVVEEGLAAMETALAAPEPIAALVEQQGPVLAACTKEAEALPPPAST